jgi:hypothetical protein
MPSPILRFAKRKAGGVAATERHNERRKSEYKSNPDIDIEASKNNYHLIEAPPATYTKAIKSRIDEVGCKTRSNSVMMIETLITASSEYLGEMSPERQRYYFTQALDFIAERVGGDNILSAVVHMDETTPHMHLCFVPITADGRLSAKDILGNQRRMSQWQTEFHSHMQQSFPELERGKSAQETGRKHIPLWLYKEATALDEKFLEVSEAVSEYQWGDSTAANRDKALSTLNAWMIEAGVFQAKVEKAYGNFDYLDRSVEETGRGIAHWKEKNVLDSVQIGHTLSVGKQLRNKIRRYDNIIAKLPPELAAAIQQQVKNKGGRSR